MEATPNGVAVRGLCVLRRPEYRRVSIWKAVVSLVLGDVPRDIDEWHVLTVNNGQGNAVASRRFVKQGEAEQARRRFVASVRRMTDDAYDRADWQSVLDAV